MQTMAMQHVGFAGRGRHFDTRAGFEHFAASRLICLGDIGLRPQGARNTGQRSLECRAHDLVAAIPNDQRRGVCARLCQRDTQDPCMRLVDLAPAVRTAGFQTIHMSRVTLGPISGRRLVLAPARARIAGIDDRDLPLVQFDRTIFLNQERDGLPAQRG